jgi:hypothetical protein
MNDNPGSGPEPVSAEPDEIQVAYQDYLQIQAEFDQASEAAGGSQVVLGTPEGDKIYELYHAAEAAYDRYSETWHAASTEPEAGQ